MTRRVEGRAAERSLDALMPIVGWLLGADFDHFARRPMLMLAIATSINALAAGVTLPMLDAPFMLSIMTIEAVTALLSSLGLFAGRRFGAMLGKRLDLVGGVALIGLGFGILFEHLKSS